MRSGVIIMAMIINRAANSPVGCSRPCGDPLPLAKAESIPIEGRAKSAQRKKGELASRWILPIGFIPLFGRDLFAAAIKCLSRNVMRDLSQDFVVSRLFCKRVYQHARVMCLIVRLLRSRSGNFHFLPFVVKTAACSENPRTSTRPISRVGRSERRSTVALSSSIRVPYSLFKASSLAARLTVSP